MKESNPIGIIAAVEGEVKNLKEHIMQGEKVNLGDSRYVRGRYKSKNLVIAHAGVGISRVRSIAQEMVEKFSPRILISIGSCGALRESIHRGDVVIGEEILLKRGGISQRGNGEDEETFSPDNELTQRMGTILKGSPFSVHHGKIISIGKFIYRRKTKEELRDRYNAIAVEMESGGIAQVAKEKGIPFIVVKVVSDELRGRLVDYNKLADLDGNLIFRRMIPYFFTKPGEAFWAIKFHRNLIKVYNRLYEVQEKILEVI